MVDIIRITIIIIMDGGPIIIPKDTDKDMNISISIVDHHNMNKFNDSPT
jgi:hypothetical protein